MPDSPPRRGLGALKAAKIGLAKFLESDYLLGACRLRRPVGWATLPQRNLGKANIGTMTMSKATALQTDSAAGTGSDILDLAALERTPLQRDPFDYLVVPDFIGSDWLSAINADYPNITGPGNAKLEDLRYGPAFDALLAELGGPALAEHMGAKFGVDLTRLPQTITVRRFCEPTDGHIHVDHRTKIITMLIYFNQGWDSDGGRLRFLRSADDIEDYAAEVNPVGGTMLAFRRSDRSFHGHKPFVGERRMVQLAWVQDGLVARTEKHVNRMSKPLRRLLNMS